MVENVGKTKKVWRSYVNPEGTRKFQQETVALPQLVKKGTLPPEPEAPPTLPDGTPLLTEPKKKHQSAQRPSHIEDWNPNAPLVEGEN